MIRVIREQLAEQGELERLVIEDTQAILEILGELGELGEPVKPV